MKRLAKILALVLLAVVVLGFSHSVINSFAASPTDACPSLGSHLIDNINPNVLVNLRAGYRNAGGSNSCWISAAFLFRTPDLTDPAKMNLFFKTAAEQQIQVVVRIASDNNGDQWEAIDPTTAEKDAEALNAAIKGKFPASHLPFAYFGNEVNLNNEWGGKADPESYAEAFYAFANSANEFKVSMAPMSYCGSTFSSNSCSAAGIGMDPGTFMTGVYTALQEIIPGSSKTKVDSWIKNNIDAYTFVVIGSTAQAIVADFQNEINTLFNAGFKDVYTKPLLISELGIPNGESEPNLQAKLWDFYQALVKSPHGSQLAATTSFVRDSGGKVHAYYYVADSSGKLAKSGEYNQAAVNLGGSTSHGSSVAVSKSGIPVYPPLGSIQICPPEIKTDSKFSEQSDQTGGSCSIDREQVNKLLYLCSHPDEAKKVEDFCGNGLSHPISINWCPSKYARGLVDASVCGDDKDENRVRRSVGQALDKICNSEFNPDDPGNTIWSFVRCQTPAPPDQQYFVSYCQAYYKNQNLEDTSSLQKTNSTNKQQLPACVPTFNAKARCVSECGQPITLNENLQIGQVTTTVGACLADSQCRAQIALKDKEGNNSFFLPFAAKLADYFAGVLDAEHQSAESLDELQKHLRDKTDQQEAMERMLNQAGVARKLLPGEVQDKLKCDFIQYVKDKKANGQNTKYLERVDGKLTGKEFTVFGKNITEIECSPEKFAKYWFAIPLFPNDESQGQIQFIAPSVFGTFAQTSITGQGGSGPFGPIYVSIPEIQRLASATGIIQKVLVPETQLDLRESLITSSDALILQKNLPTYGKEINPNTYIPPNACSANSWSDFYDNTKQIVYDETKNFRVDGETPNAVPGLTESGAALTEYSRAVTCEIPSLAGTPDSKICTVGPLGELKCSTQDKPGGTLTTGPENLTETVQVRTVFPHLFDIAEQTIGRSTGLLRLFKPEAVKQGKADEFEKAFDPIPASTDNVYFYLPTSNGLSIDDSKHKDTGWKIYFYKLGGLWNAREFLLDLLDPLPQGGSNAGIK